MDQQLVRENEALHALLADACSVLGLYAELGREGQAARDCLQRVTDGEPLPPFAAEDTPPGG